MTATRVDFDVPKKHVREQAARCNSCGRRVVLWRDFKSTGRTFVLDVDSAVDDVKKLALRLEPHVFHCHR